MSPAVSLPCWQGRVIPPLHETSCVELVALVQRDVPRNKCCRPRGSPCDSCRDLPDEGCLWKRSACLQSDNLFFCKDVLVLAGKIWIHWSTPFVWPNIRIPALTDFKSFLSWFWALCSVLKRSSAWCGWWKQRLMDCHGITGRGGRGLCIRRLPRRWQPRDGWAGGAAPGPLRCWPCWEIQALASAVAHESATVALRNETFRLLDFELDFWPFSQLTLCTGAPSKL